MNLIKNQQELEKILFETINKIDKSIKIFGGHLPLLYHDEGIGKKSVEFSVDIWGNFSNYTFELSCMALKYAKEKGKDAKIMVVVDDIVEIPIKKAYEDGKVERENVTKVLKIKRKQLYDSGKIPESYENILSQYGLTKNDLLTHKRKSGNETNMISEISIKAIANENGFISKNECAQAYKGIIYNKDFFNIEKYYLISFIPGQCKGNICTGLLDDEIKLNALHFFFPHMEELGGLIGLKNGTYIKNPNKNPLTIEEMYKEGITYRFDKGKIIK
jgi:hypothetical protein